MELKKMNGEQGAMYERIVDDVAACDPKLGEISGDSGNMFIFSEPELMKVDGLRTAVLVRFSIKIEELAGALPGDKHRMLAYLKSYDDSEVFVAEDRYGNLEWDAMTEETKRQFAQMAVNISEPVSLEAIQRIMYGQLLEAASNMSMELDVIDEKMREGGDEEGSGLDG